MTDFSSKPDSQNVGTHDKDADATVQKMPGRLIPLTIRQIISCEASENGSLLVNNGTVLETVKIVGRVLGTSGSVSEGKAHILLSDGTGCFSVKIMPKDDVDRVAFENAEIGTYYRVFGRVTNLNNEKRFLVQSFSKIEYDFNEVTRHLISAVWTNLTHQGCIPDPVVSFTNSNGSPSKQQQHAG